MEYVKFKKKYFTEDRGKPDYKLIVSTGLYVVNEKVMKIIPKSKEYNFDKLISDVIKKKHKISVYKIDDKSWIDVGHWDGFKKI